MPALDGAPGLAVMRGVDVGAKLNGGWKGLAGTDGEEPRARTAAAVERGEEFGEFAVAAVGIESGERRDHSGGGRGRGTEAFASLDIVDPWATTHRSHSPTPRPPAPLLAPRSNQPHHSSPQPQPQPPALHSLPHDCLLHIAHLLPSAALLALSHSSRLLYASLSCDSSLWRNRCRQLPHLSTQLAPWLPDSPPPSRSPVFQPSWFKLLYLRILHSHAHLLGWHLGDRPFLGELVSVRLVITSPPHLPPATLATPRAPTDLDVPKIQAHRVLVKNTATANLVQAGQVICDSKGTPLFTKGDAALDALVNPFAVTNGAGNGSTPTTPTSPTTPASPTAHLTFPHAVTINLLASHVDLTPLWTVQWVPRGGFLPLPPATSATTSSASLRGTAQAVGPMGGKKEGYVVSTPPFSTAVWSAVQDGHAMAVCLGGKCGEMAGGLAGIGGWSARGVARLGGATTSASAAGVLDDSEVPDGLAAPLISTTSASASTSTFTSTVKFTSTLSSPLTPTFPPLQPQPPTPPAMTCHITLHSTLFSSTSQYRNAAVDVYNRSYCSDASHVEVACMGGCWGSVVRVEERVRDEVAEEERDGEEDSDGEDDDDDDGDGSDNDARPTSSATTTSAVQTRRSLLRWLSRSRPPTTPGSIQPTSGNTRPTRKVVREEDPLEVPAAPRRSTSITASREQEQTFTAPVGRGAVLSGGSDDMSDPEDDGTGDEDESESEGNDETEDEVVTPPPRKASTRGDIPAKTASKTSTSTSAGAIGWFRTTRKPVVSEREARLKRFENGTWFKNGEDGGVDSLAKTRAPSTSTAVPALGEVAEVKGTSRDTTLPMHVRERLRAEERDVERKREREAGGGGWWGGEKDAVALSAQPSQPAPTATTPGAPVPAPAPTPAPAQAPPPKPHRLPVPPRDPHGVLAWPRDGALVAKSSYWPFSRGSHTEQTDREVDKRHVRELEEQLRSSGGGVVAGDVRGSEDRDRPAGVGKSKAARENQERKERERERRRAAAEARVQAEEEKERERRRKEKGKDVVRDYDADEVEMERKAKTTASMSAQVVTPPPTAVVYKPKPTTPAKDTPFPLLPPPPKPRETVAAVLAGMPPSVDVKVEDVAPVPQTVQQARPAVSVTVTPLATATSRSASVVSVASSNASVVTSVNSTSTSTPAPAPAPSSGTGRLVDVDVDADADLVVPTSPRDDPTSPTTTVITFSPRYFRLRVPAPSPPPIIARRFARLRASAMSTEPFPRDPPPPGPANRAWHPSLLAGVWVSTYRTRDPAFLYVRCVEPGRELWAFKLTGNVNVPRGKLSWRAFVEEDGATGPVSGGMGEGEGPEDEDGETPWGVAGGAPVNRIVGTPGSAMGVAWINVPGVVRRYMCKKQFAHPGYKDPHFSDGELLVISNDEMCVYSYKHHHITRYMRMPDT